MISFIVPTTGRPSLIDTLRSIECQAGDEILVIGNGGDVALDPRVTHIRMENRHDWGATERMVGLAAAKGRYLAFMDDDDVYAPCARGYMADAVATTPDQPVLFRMQYPDGHQLWATPAIAMGNVSTQMMLIPNDRAKLGSWLSGRRECDFDFLASSGWLTDQFVFRPEVLSYRSEEKYVA